MTSDESTWTREAEGPSVAKLVRFRAYERRSPAFVHGATGAGLDWTSIAEGAGTWGRNRRQLTDQGQRCVGLLVEDPLYMIAAFLGALAAGVGVAPLNAGASAAELVPQVRALGVQAIVTDLADRDLLDRLRDAGGDLWFPSGPDLERRLPATGARPPVPPGRAALVLASSGTSGQPKIIPLAEDQLLHASRAVAGHHQLSADDTGYCPLPLFHINALVVGVLSTLIAGSRLVVDRRYSGRGFWPTVAAHDVTWLNLVPAIIGALAGSPGGPAASPDGIRFARSASSPLAPATRERFERRFGISVLETYGMTEAASQITANPLDVGDRRSGSVGLPVGTEVRIMGPGGSPVPAGETGEVEIRGPSVTTGHWPPAGTTVLRSAASGHRAGTGAGADWLPTADIGYVDADGYLYLVGRRDDVINRGGEKFYPREVENVLLADRRLVSAVVVGRPHPTVGEEPVAFVLARVDPDERADLVAQLNQQCEVALSRYKRPVGITVADTLPLGPTGKVRHSALGVLAGGPTLGDAPPATRPTGARPIVDLDLPSRSSKPRTHGLTMVIDNGMPSGLFEDAVTSAVSYIDMVKFGWGTAMVTDDLERKIECLRGCGVRFCFGGTLFEKFVVQDRFESFLALCHHFRCDFVEVSNGTIPLPDTAKAAYVRRCAGEFTVVSEVGLKDPRRSAAVDSDAWIHAINADLEAGAELVITEARESGRAGICTPDGELRSDLLDDILSSGIDPDRLLFEAPTKSLQTELITRLGTNVNLGNISAGDVLGVETLRLGLRSDTFMRFEQAALHA